MEKAKRCAIFGNTYQPKKSEAAQKLFDALTDSGIVPLVDRPFFDYLKGEMHVSIPEHQLIDGNDFEADIAVSMGGDGTFLTTAMRVGKKEIPILGINTGRLGFLADFSLDDIAQTLNNYHAGLLRTEQCNVLQVECEKGTCIQGYPFALNEVAVLKRDNSSMISIRVDLGGEYLTTYQADGLVVNTPTGSTAYALSVGGPVMLPGSQNIGLVPVAPHGLTVRPMTLPDNLEITLTVESRSHNFLVAIDGRSETCRDRTRITIRKASYHVFVLKRPETTFLHTLRSKLLWGSDARIVES
ncbi:MAG: NAD kinase [Bacteroidaceae bacterium]|nr:NAD kinase [Bacteroidaceae bacterium]